MENHSAERRRISLNAPLLTVLFAATALCAALISKMCVTDSVYAPVTPDYSAVSFMDAVSLAASAGRSAAIQMLFLFVSGFTPFAPAAAAAILTYRGACAGYTAAALACGMIDPTPGTFLGIPGDVLIPALYFLATVPMIAQSALSVSYSRALLRRGEDCPKPKSSKYFILFILLSGISALISVFTSLIE